MAWIEAKPEEQWDPKVGEVLSAFEDPATGKIDHILTIHSQDLGSLNAHLAIYRQAMKPTNSLPKIEREMIALLVSKLNHCRY